MVIRKAVKTDFKMICDFIKNLWSYNNYDELKLKDVFDETIGDDNSFIYVLEDDEGIGFVHGCVFNTFWMSGKTCYVSSLYVKDEYRKKGYGKMLIEYIKRHAIENEYKAIILDSGFPRKEAHDFYENNGFEKSCYGFEQILE